MPVENFKGVCMKFLLMLSLLASSAFALADDYQVRCYDRTNTNGVEYVINVNKVKTLWRCVGSENNCLKLGLIKKVHTVRDCLVLTADPMEFTLCQNDHTGDETGTTTGGTGGGNDHDHDLVKLPYSRDGVVSQLWCDRTILPLL
jgi:hypothetical protein